MFLDNFLIAAEQVAILYILVAVGFIADRTKLFTEKAARLCTDLMFYIITRNLFRLRVPHNLPFIILT